MCAEVLHEIDQCVLILTEPVQSAFIGDKDMTGMLLKSVAC